MIGGASDADCNFKKFLIDLEIVSVIPPIEGHKTNSTLEVSPSHAHQPARP